jgi:hypothetical protein
MHHAKRMRLYILPSVAQPTLQRSPHYLTKDKIKKLKVKSVFWFSLQLLSEIFLILRRIQRDIVINTYKPSSKVPVVLVRF